jgi:hypothetical protein
VQSRLVAGGSGGAHDLRTLPAREGMATRTAIPTVRESARPAAKTVFL